jgi:Ca2+-binding RTX toxin-like protein
MALHYPAFDITRSGAEEHGIVVASADTVIVGAEIDIVALGANASAIAGTNVSGTSIRIKGSLISAEGTGIYLPHRVWTDENGSDGNRITVEAGGSVSGLNGIFVEGAHNWIHNAGDISGSNYGVHLRATIAQSGSTVSNAGSISGYDALYVAGGWGQVTNSGTLFGTVSNGLEAENIELAVMNTGLIQGAGAGLAGVNAKLTISNAGTIAGHAAITGRLTDWTPDAVTTFELVNTGVIQGVWHAIYLESDSSFRVWTARIENAGTISGRVQLHDGDDLYDGTAGKLTGVLEAGRGSDTLLGGSFGDQLRGGGGEDEIDGGAGDDVIEGGDHADILQGGAGLDTLSYATSWGAVTVNLQTGEFSGAHAEGDAAAGFERVAGSAFHDTIGGASGNETLIGHAGADSLAGGAGNDDLQGGADNDRLNGGIGDDVLRGGAGNDILSELDGNGTLNGGEGDDTLIGGAGRDVLTGGLGADQFRYMTTADSSAAANGRDRVSDFTPGLDVIDLSRLDAQAGTPGTNEAFVFIGAGAFAGVAGQLRAGAVAGGVLVEGDVNGDKVADFSIAVAGLASLAGADFLL